ncbi:DUF6753 family protein [Crocosphaera sp. XPORK-15E]|uniref:DUF6753 family protein n=1 Tax=Crocosphaera sp. XPORK-15E TaxID=3110247 RepID=UPI002B1F56A5|nr:DUF6753 family protein [Crocosphaera sp. XPORK-15E]MEA5536934.1 DUF6753 family protein [Crocosphaera sp. XPORK-15E]
MIDSEKNNPEETPNNYQGEVTTLLGELLENKDDEFVAKVMTLVFKLGVNPDDPMFVILGALGNLEFLLESAPAALQEQFKEWRQDIGKLQEQEHKKAISDYKKDISRAVGELITLTEKRAKSSFKSLVPAGAILLGTFCFGAFMGITVPPWLEGGYSNKKLTQTQAESLNWAMSGEGKYARQIMEWNKGYFANCEQDVQKLGVKLSYGTQERINGFCVVWVKPPGQRKGTP